jgi:acyl-[acyl carrier protein]--UDP-N-acetylglucosamine O-acyltransferase
MIDYGKITRRFLLGEALEELDTFSYIQSLEEALSKISTNVSGQRRLKVAKEHLRNIRREVRRINKKVVMLEEQVKVLEESKEK